MELNKIFSIIGALGLFFLPFHQNPEYDLSTLTLEGAGTIFGAAGMALLFWIVAIGVRKLYDSTIGTREYPKLRYLTVFAWSSCLVGVMQHLKVILE